MEGMRLEIAQELGLDGAREGYLGDVTCVQCGHYGHLLYTRAKQLLQHSATEGASERPQAKTTRKKRSAGNAESGLQAEGHTGASQALLSPRDGKRGLTAKHIAGNLTGDAEFPVMSAEKSADTAGFVRVPKTRQSQAHSESPRKVAGRTRSRRNP